MRRNGWGGDWLLDGLMFLVIAATTVVLVVAVVVACNPNEPKSGRVVGRPHYAAWVQISTTCTKYGCTVIPISHPERWELCVIPDERQGDFAEQYCFGVSREMWDRKPLGEHYYAEDGA